MLSLLFLGGALLLIGDLFAEWGGPGMGVLGVAALLLYPTAFFLAAFYTESLFLLLSAASLWGARRGRWIIAGAAGFAACLTRLNGFLLAPAMAVSAISARRGADARLEVRLGRGRSRHPGRRGRLPGLSLATLGRSASLRAQQGGRVGAASRAGLGSGPQRLRRLSSATCARRAAGGKLMLFAEVASTLLFVALTVAVFRRGLIAEGVFVGGTLLLLLFSGTLDGIHRYVLVLFPCFLPLAQSLRARPALAFAYAFGGAGFGIVFLHRFVHWIHVG